MKDFYGQVMRLVNSLLLAILMSGFIVSRPHHTFISYLVATTGNFLLMFWITNEHFPIFTETQEFMLRRYAISIVACFVLIILLTIIMHFEYFKITVSRSEKVMENSHENLLEIKNLTLTRGKSTILNNLSLELRENEIMGLLGANGSGKTTLINILTGNIYPK